MNAPAFFVDECLPADVTLAIRQHGLDVTDIFERGRRGIDDGAVWALAASENRILVTRDLDFPLRNRLPNPPGLVLLRVPDGATANPSALLGHITVVLPGRYRQRAW